MRKVAVIGANGFLGRNLIQELLTTDTEVIAVYNNNRDSIDPKCTAMTSSGLISSNLDLDCVYFLGGNYANTHKEMIAINCELLIQLTNRFPASKWLYVSSTNVYGTHTEAIHEDSCYCNPGLYAQSKLAGEFIVRSLPHYAIARLTYLYGRGITNNSFIPRIIKAATGEGTITLFGNGERKQDYMHIKDAVLFCIAASLNPVSGIYLGATGIATTNGEVAETIKILTGCTINYTGQETGESFTFNPAATFKKLNWAPQTSFTEGIKSMIE
jgi:UDP-glucose 4-epimerase